MLNRITSSSTGQNTRCARIFPVSQALEAREEAQLTRLQLLGPPARVLGCWHDPRPLISEICC